jgi:outer membrane protein assembly factor BamD
MSAPAKVTDYPAATPRGRLNRAAVARLPVVSPPVVSMPLARLLLIALLATLSIAGCGRGDRDMRSGAEELFERGTKSMRSGNFTNAISYYESLEARYPFSNQAKQAQLNLVYAYYRNGERELSVDAATQFERENPTHPRVDYALYMRGIANFAPEHNMFHRMFRVKLWKRPPVNARDSYSAFSRLVQRYPQSRYAPDAHQRMVFLRNRMAEHENYIAEYYYQRGAFVAAANRAKYVVETFEGAPAVADSLFIVMSSYEKLGMQDLAGDARRVLEENYPDAVQPPATKKRFFFF